MRVTKLLKKINKKTVGFAVFAMLLVINLFTLNFVGIQVAEAEPGTVVSIDPTTRIANPGDTFAVNISVTDVIRLYSWEVKVQWQPVGLLEVTNVVEGPFLKTGGITFFSKIINNLAGYFQASALILSPPPPAGHVNGTGVLATATFKVKDTGRSTLDLGTPDTDTILLEPDGVTKISHTSVDGNFFTTMPVASFTYTPLAIEGHPMVNETITFDASASNDPDGGTIASYRWDFGDGNITTVSTSTITHVYATNQSYTLNLRVTDDEAETYNKTDFVVVYPSHFHDVAVINVTATPTDASVGTLVKVYVTVLSNGSAPVESLNVTSYYVTANGTFKPIGTQTVSPALGMGTNRTLTFNWDTTGIDASTYVMAAYARLTHPATSSVQSPDEQSLYDIKLSNNILINGTVALTPPEKHDVAVTSVTVSPTNLKLGFSSSISVIVTNKKGMLDETNLNVTAYYDSTHLIGTQTIELEAGTSETLTFSSWFTANTTSNEGTYLITVTVPLSNDETPTDNTKNATANMRLYPVAQFSYTPTTPATGETLTFDASASYTPGLPTGTITKYSWDFGDGTTKTYVGANLTATTTHTYTANGSYTASLVVTDDTGLTDTMSRSQIAVGNRDVAIVSVTSMPYKVTSGQSVSIDVLVKNKGVFQETFTLTLYRNTTAIETKPVSILDAGSTRTVRFTWNTAGVTGGFYTISVEASSVLHEVNEDDNTVVVGSILLEKISSTLTLSASPTTLTIGGKVTLNGTISLAKGGLEVTLWVSSTGTSWSALTTATTDTQGKFLYEWTPTVTGTYALKASWSGDSVTQADESDVQVVSVQEAPPLNIFLFTTIGMAILVVVVLVYSVKLRKPKT